MHLQVCYKTPHNIKRVYWPLSLLILCLRQRTHEGSVGIFQKGFVPRKQDREQTTGKQYTFLTLC